MSFPFTWYAAAGLGALLASLLSLPLWRRWCEKIGLVDDPGHRKIHSRPMPLAGGLAVATGLILPFLAGWVWLVAGGKTMPLPNLLEYGFDRRALQIIGILLGAVGMLMVGLADDRFELAPHWKFLGQALVAAGVAASGTRITLFVENEIFSYVVSVLWILTLINALNFMDNMNGLCGGLGAISAWTFAWLAAASGQYLVATSAFAVCGALTGFLPHNFPRARSFLGDAGSHLTGYLVAVLGILPHFHTAEAPRRAAVLVPLLVLAVPLIDLAQVVTRRTLSGKPFYIGDTNHLSHLLNRRGASCTSAVLWLWLIAAMAGLGAMLVLR
jgi:UDP-GlcNAc:undecaprenyl-phosphate GlcNAc-1-phosphate transferase